MKRLEIPDAENMVLAIQNEIRRSEESRYDHRLHGLLLVAHGLSCLEVSHLLGDAPRSVQYWVKRFQESGLGGLTEGERSGRPGRLKEAHLQDIEKALRKTPAEAGLKEGGVWDGKTLSTYLEKKHGVRLQARQCQRLFRQLDFRLRKPRPLIARADPERQAAHKKTPQAGQKSDH